MRSYTTASAVAVIAAFYSSAAATAQTAPPCTHPNALGVSRTVQIDTTGGPGFGFEHYKANDFLQPKEVVLTFDDGPQKYSTEAVLAALAEQCVKATFFSIGKMALGYPEIIREVAHAGHTVGTHTWSHKAIAKLKTFEEGKDEIERGISAVHRAVGGPVAPFFRYPTLIDTKESLEYLGKRNIAMFSTDIDSLDFKIQSPESIVKTVMTKLAKNGKGIILMHDIHKKTARAVPLLLAALKQGGYKVVHLTPKTAGTTVAEYDAAIEKDAKGLPQVGQERPVSAIVKTVEGDVPEAEKAARESAGAKAAPAEAAASAQHAAAPEHQETPAPAQGETTSETAEPEGIPPPPAEEGQAETVPGTHGQTEMPHGSGGTAAATGALSETSAAAPAGEPPAAKEGEAASPPAPAPKTWSARAAELWESWFGK
ncbi:MAG: polysaccharide deacetylase family protein [Hyphomicrobium sp.]|nr:polysaccharide deacetylase family protein [Hyphomicrobium sp.]